jgi:small-conductance mechanosensitive channel
MWETLASTAASAFASDQAPLLVDSIRRNVETGFEQYLATVALALSFLVVVWMIYLGGPALQRRYSEEVVDIARTLIIMIVAMISAVVLVVIWKVEPRVREALRESILPQNPGRTALVAFIAFLVILGTYVLSRVTKRIVRHWSEQGRISPHQRELAHHGIQIGLFVVSVTFIVALLFNRNPRDFFLGAGVVGIVVGFAARRTLADVLAGFVILFGRPFEAGDWIAVGERQGIVTDITAFNTQIRTFNEEHVLVPNDAVMDREVINYSKTERLRLTTEVGIDYDADITEAATIAKETMESCDNVADTPNPDVILQSFGDSAVLLQLRYWIDKPTIQRKLSAQNEVIDGVKAAFESEGVKIPFPQRELMGREETDGLRVASDSEVSVDDEVERAVRRVRTDSTAVREPVEERYRVNELKTEAGITEPVEDEYRDDDETEGDPEKATGEDGQEAGDGDDEDGTGEERRGAPPELVEEKHDVSAPPRERMDDVDRGEDITEPVESKYRDDSEGDESDDEEAEQ